MPADRVKQMFPMMLDVTMLPIMIIGGPGILERLVALERDGAAELHVFAPAPTPELAAASAGKLLERWPDKSDFSSIRPKLVFIADVADDFASVLRGFARDAGALVHVQDRIPLCDFHLPARVRRGHLQVTVSTDGTAAGLSRHIREYLEAHVFGPEWAERVEEIAAARHKWKQDGMQFADLGKAIAEFVAARGWLRRP